MHFWDDVWQQLPKLAKTLDTLHLIQNCREHHLIRVKDFWEGEEDPRGFRIWLPRRVWDQYGNADEILNILKYL